MQMHPKKLPIGSLHSSRSLTLSRRDPTSYSDSGANWLRFVTSTGLAESHLHAQNCTSDAAHHGTHQPQRRPGPNWLRFVTSTGLAESHLRTNLHKRRGAPRIEPPPTPTRSNRLRFVTSTGLAEASLHAQCCTSDAARPMAQLKYKRKETRSIRIDNCNRIESNTESAYRQWTNQALVDKPSRPWPQRA